MDAEIAPEKKRRRRRRTKRAKVLAKVGSSGVVQFIVFAAAAAYLYFSVLDSFFVATDLAIVDGASEYGIDFDLDIARLLASLSWTADFRIWGYRPWGYRLTNVLLHAASATVIYHCALRLITRKRIEDRPPFAWLAGFVFLFLPSHTEAVAWISARATLLATLFALLSFWLFLRHRRWGRKSDWAWSLIAFGLSLLAHWSVISLPPILLWYRFSHRHHRKNQHVIPWRWLSAYFGVGVIYLAARYWLRDEAIGVAGPAWRQLYFSTDALLSLMVKGSRSFLPPLSHRLVYYAVLGVLLAIAIGGLLYERRRSRPPIVKFLLGAYLIVLLPILPLMVQFDTPIGERFLYWPSAFGVLLLTGGLSILPVNREMVYAVTILLCYAGYNRIQPSLNAWQFAGSYSRRFASCMVVDSRVADGQAYTERYIACLTRSIGQEAGDMEAKLAVDLHIPPQPIVDCVSAEGDSCFGDLPHLQATVDGMIRTLNRHHHLEQR